MSAPQRGATAYVEGVGLLGPGLASWSEGRAILLGQAPAIAARTVVPVPVILPAAERRRAGVAVKIALAAGQEALALSGTSPQLPTVFTSSGGDGTNCHVICESLASADRLISPTRFHNSVHNAASGYWHIAMGAMSPSQALCAHDGSFAAGLLEAVCQAVADRTRVLLIAYDTEYPEPLHGVRPIPDAFAAALLISPERGEHCLASLTLGDGCMTSDAAQALPDEVLESVRRQIPAARGLPLLQALASGSAQRVVIDYLADARLAVDVAP